jgi:hypothetical protein
MVSLLQVGRGLYLLDQAATIVSTSLGAYNCRRLLEKLGPGVSTPILPDWSRNRLDGDAWDWNPKSGYVNDCGWPFEPPRPQRNLMPITHIRLRLGLLAIVR